MEYPVLSKLISRYAEVAFQDGTKVTGLIIPDGKVIEGNMFYSNVVIFDTSNSIIYINPNHNRLLS
jgi:hypothetical protein